MCPRFMGIDHIYQFVRRFSVRIFSGFLRKCIGKLCTANADLQRHSSFGLNTSSRLWNHPSTIKYNHYWVVTQHIPKTWAPSSRQGTLVWLCYHSPPAHHARITATSRQCLQSTANLLLSGTLRKRITTVHISQLLVASYIKAATMVNAVNGVIKAGMWLCVFDQEFEEDTATRPQSTVGLEIQHESQLLVGPNSKVGPEYPFSAESPVGAQSSGDSQSTVGLRSLVGSHSLVGQLSTAHTQFLIGPQSPVGPQSTVGHQPVVSPQSPAPRVVISTMHTWWTLLFRSIVVSTNPSLQIVLRNSTGRLNDPILQINERFQADAMRATTVQFICEHVDEFTAIEVRHYMLTCWHAPKTHVSILFASRTHQFDVKSNRCDWK